MSAIWSNPEFIRNARIQLRPGRALAIAAICLVVSLTIWFSMTHKPKFDPTAPTLGGFAGPGAVFILVMNLQLTLVLLGGGIYCVQSVNRERELNTFDYQRVTRLTPAELTFGKLFGAPIATYFMALCLTPVAIAGALSVHLPVRLLAEIYIVILVGCISYHTLMLLVSVLLRKSGLAVSVLVYLLLVGVTTFNSAGEEGPWALHTLNPYCVNEILINYIQAKMHRPGWSPLQDAFAGLQMPHALVVIILYVFFGGWFLMATVRNIKRDPSTAEALSPGQTFGFVTCLCALMLGFFRWRQQGATLETDQTLLGISVCFFLLLILALIRNRAQVRRRIRMLGLPAASWWNAFWPAPFVVAISVLEGAVIYAATGHVEHAWPPATSALTYVILFTAVWLARDTLYLQWMALRRNKRPLGAGLLYLLVFYTCIGIVFSATEMYNLARSTALTGALLPTGLFGIDARNWADARNLWLVALAIQAATALLFAWLHWRKLQEIANGSAQTASSKSALAQTA